MNFVWKKWIILVLLSVLPLSSVWIMSIFGIPFLFALVGSYFFAIIMIVLAWFFLRHPLLAWIEGTGLLAADINSTGIISWYKVTVAQSRMTIGYGKGIKSFFNRKLFAPFAVFPQELEATEQIDKDGDGEIVFRIKKQDYPKAIFGTTPTRNILFFNGKTKNVITKDFLAEGEDKLLADHMLYDLKESIDVLGEQMGPFAKYIVDLMAKALGGFKMPSYWIIIAILVFLALAYFSWPYLTGLIGGASGTAAKVAGGIAGSKAITPV